MSIRRTLSLLATICALAVVVSILGSGSVGRVVVVAVINIILVVAYHLFSGLSGVLSFGHMAFATVGGYVAGLLVMPAAAKAGLMPGLPAFLGSAELSPVLAVLAAGAAAGVVAALVAVPLTRTSGLAAGLASAAMLLAVRDVAVNWDAVTRGQRGLSPLPISTTLTTALVWLVVTVAVGVVYERSAWGLRLRATRADLVAASAAGIGFRAERAKALIVSGSLTGVGGALFVLLLGSITPDVFFLDYTFLVIAMAVVGGFGSMEGALLGAASVGLMNELLRQVEQGSLFGLIEIPARAGIARAGLGLLLLAVLLLRPRGLVSVWGKGGSRHVPPDPSPPGDHQGPSSSKDNDQEGAAYADSTQ